MESTAASKSAGEGSSPSVRAKPYISEELAQAFARYLPIDKVIECGLYKHPHAESMTEAALRDASAGHLRVDMDSCQVALWPGYGDDGQLQDFAFARLPCGRWLYWQERGSP